MSYTNPHPLYHTFSTFPVQVRLCQLLLENALLLCAAVHKDDLTSNGMQVHVLFRVMGNRPASAFSYPRSRCYPYLFPSPLLHSSCTTVPVAHEGTSLSCPYTGKHGTRNRQGKVRERQP